MLNLYHTLLFDVGQCSSFSMLVAVAVILALLALLTLVLALSILLCFLQRKK